MRPLVKGHGTDAVFTPMLIADPKPQQHSMGTYMDIFGSLPSEELSTGQTFYMPSGTSFQDYDYDSWSINTMTSEQALRLHDAAR